jgi:hypothetical protein
VQKNIFYRFFLLAMVVIMIAISSCKKAEIQPVATENESTPTLIFIRAVDKDSTFINSDQLPLR